MANTQINYIRSDTQATVPIKAIDLGDGTFAFATAGVAGIAGPPIGAGEAFIGQVGSPAVVASTSVTRPADTTAYAVGDLVANSTTPGVVVPLSWSVARVAGGCGMIRKARIKSNRTTAAVPTGGSFKLWLFQSSPTVTNGDNGAILPTQAASYLGVLSFVIDRAMSDGVVGNGTPDAGSEILFDLASGTTIYGLLECRGAFTPVSGEVFTIELEVLQL